MHHRHTILRQRDSLSDDVSSQTSLRSENQTFLASRHSSTASNTIESTHNIQKTNLSTHSSAKHKQSSKPMNNDHILHHRTTPTPGKQRKSDHTDQASKQPPVSSHTVVTVQSADLDLPSTALTPIESGVEHTPSLHGVKVKVPTKQNKPTTSSDDDNDNEPTESPPCNELELSPISDEKDDELSDLPPATAARPPLRFMGDKMRVESASQLTTSPSVSQNAYAVFQHAPVIDSSHAMKPSEVKKESHKSDTQSPAKSKAQALSDLLMDIDKKEQIEHHPPEIKTLNVREKSIHNRSIKRNKKKRNRSKRNKKSNKCDQCCTNTKLKYRHYNETSICCKRFRRLQFFGRRYVTTTSLFRWTILVCILLNCVFIAMEDPTGDADSGRNKLVRESETIFAIIFTAEMAIKMFCNGLFGNHMPEKEGGKSEEDIQNEIKQNKENEKQNADREASANPINQTTESIDRGTEPKLEILDPKQAIEMEDFGHDIPTGITHRESVSFRDRRAGSGASSSTWASTQQSSSLSTDRQQNDRDPKYYVGYFRDNWNILDFIIVVTSWIEWLPIEGGSNLTAIRVLRVLRPLRTFTKIKSLKVLIATIIKSLRGLSDVLVLLLFLFVVFAIIGIQMFNGKLRQQCFSDDFRDKPRSQWCCDDPAKWVEDENFCILKTGETGNNRTHNGCPSELPWCLNIAPNPNGEVTNFDNIIYAMLNVFVTISLEGWAAIQYKLEDTGCSLAWLYFVLLTFIVGFFAANLCLAVIESVYGDEMKKKHKKESKEMEKKHRNGDGELKPELQILKQAIDETNAAWREQKKAKMVIQTEPDTPQNGTTPMSVSLLHPSLRDGHIPSGDREDEDQSFYKIDSFRLPYVGANGQESEFRTRIVKELQSQNPPPLTEFHDRCKSVDTRPSHSNRDKIPFSSHQAGLIQTSEEWNDLQLDAIHKDNTTHEAEEVDTTNTNTKKKVNHHKRTSSFKLKKNKKVKFSHGLGLGTQSYMHRYRTGHLPQSSGGSPLAASQSHGHLHGNLQSPMSGFTPYTTTPFAITPNYNNKGSVKGNKVPYGAGYFSDNDENEEKSIDLSTENDGIDMITPPAPVPAVVQPSQFKRSSNLSVEERRAKFANSRFSKSGHSFSGTHRRRKSKKLAADITRLDVLKKVDYKTGTKENFESAMNRVKLYVNASKKEELENDVREYTQIKSADNIFDQSHGDLVDDLTFGDMPLQLEMEHMHNKSHNEPLTDELKHKKHIAKRKRKQNEILARRAIIIANTAPKWTEWVEARDAPWIDAINALVVSSIFQSVIMFIIIANTVVLALTWPEQDERLKDILESVNAVFTFIFILEAVLKLIGLGPRAYFADNWNKFDFIIVFVSICEMLVGLASPGTMSGGSAISALRSMRLLRAFRLLGKFDKLKQLFMLVVASMHEVSLLTLVLAIFIFMFAALAMSLFGGKLILLGDRRSGRWRFDNFYWSWVNVFMVISGDSWNEVMYDTVKATEDRTTTIYYVIVVCFGTFVILNLFVAILLSKMSSEDSEADFMLDGLVKYSSAMWIHSVDKQDQVDRLVMSIERKKYIAQFKDKRSKWKHHRDKDAMEGKSLGIFDPHNAFRILCHRIVQWRWFELSIDILILVNCVFLAMESPAARVTSQQMFTVADIFFTVLFVLEFLIKVIALGAFQQPFRKGRSWRSVTDDDKLLEWTDRSYQAVFFMHRIDAHSILDLPGLAIECIESNDGYCIVHLWGQQVLRIVYHNGSFSTAYKLVDQQRGIWELWHSDVSCVVDSELETVLTSFDLTDHHHNAYFASNWNRLDAVVVLVAVLGVGFENVSFLRALRAFRPFRIMVRFKKIKVVLGALLRAIPGLMNTFLFCILFWFVLSILGVSWFNGKYRHCRIADAEMYDTICGDLDAEIVTNPLCDLCSDACVMYNLNKTQCESYAAHGLIWMISVFNFDNVFEALHSLFVVATLSGWNFVMYEAVDSTQLNAALREDNYPQAAVYFMVVVVLCSFFSLNLIVSVVVDNFNTIKAEKDGSAFQTEEQALWVNNQRLLERISLDPTFWTPRNWFRRWSFIIVQHSLFDPFIMSCIILNAVSMGLEHYDQTDTWTLALRIADIVFVMIFCLEAILKIAAYGFTLYIISNWNKFDFIISIVGLVQLLTDSGLGLNVLRLFRVGRLLRLLHKAKTLKMLFWTLVYSIPSLWNIGLLLFVIFFIYAVVGMHILTDYVTEVHDEVNANDFWSAVSLLYRVGTEDGWTDVYQAYLEAWPSDERYKIYIYFISFFVLGTLVLINLFIAVVLDSFEENHKSFSREDKFTIIQIWRDIWSYFDADAKREIAVRDFIDILRLTPKSDAFEEKHKIIGPGFFDGNPFEVLLKKMQNDNLITHSRTSLSFSRSSIVQSIVNRKKRNSESQQGGGGGGGDEESSGIGPYDTNLLRKINAIYDVETRQEKLREICPDVSHSDMIKLLLRLRLRVELHEDDSQELTCFGKLAKLMYEICNSMGIGTRQQKDELIKQHTLKNKTSSKSKKDDGGDRDGGGDDKETRKDTLSEKEKKELQNELKSAIDFESRPVTTTHIHDPLFDIGHKTWYVSYDDALLALCSEVIGPRLPDGFPMFAIAKQNDDSLSFHAAAAAATEREEETVQLRIAEWYTIKHDCYHVFKKVTFDIENNKQFPEIVPSQHVSDQRQKELQLKTRASVQFKKEFKKIQNQIATNKLQKKQNINVFMGNNQNIIEEEDNTAATAAVRDNDS